uniref:Uncharacterized protein n=1 Tax=Steinernema glaseri TaxID=37863 RepID=A0A1I8A627_9BILA
MATKGLRKPIEEVHQHRNILHQSAISSKSVNSADCAPLSDPPFTRPIVFLLFLFLELVANSSTVTLRSSKILTAVQLKAAIGYQQGQEPLQRVLRHLHKSKQVPPSPLIFMTNLHPSEGTWKTATTKAYRDEKESHGF